MTHGSEKNGEILDGVSEPIQSRFGPSARLLVVSVLWVMISTSAPVWRKVGFGLIGLAALLALKPWVIDPACRFVVSLLGRSRK